MYGMQGNVSLVPQRFWRGVGRKVREEDRVEVIRTKGAVLLLIPML
jgi:hypothetical protein